MPILPPSLDDRSFDDLVNELLARIPSHTPEWTDPRPGDPGRTVLELFAWLADTLLYRANLTPEKQRLAFLKLLGLPLKPAIAAQGWISLSHKRPDDRRLFQLKPRALVSGGAVPVETCSEITVLPIELQVVVKQRLSASETHRYGDVVAGLSSVYNLSATEQATPYFTRPLFNGGKVEPGGFSTAGNTVDGCYWLALLCPDQGDPLKQIQFNSEVIAALGGENGQQTLLNVGVLPTLELPPDFGDPGTRLSLPHAWDISAPPQGDGEARYQTLRVVEDSSAGLQRAGVIRLALPAGPQIGVPGSNDVRQFLRAGVGDFPPRLDDPATASRLVAWIRLRPLSPAPPSGASASSAALPDLSLSWLGLNVVAVDQRRTLEGVVLGQSSGEADQQFSLPAPSVEAASLEIQVEEAGIGYQPWTKIEDLALAGRNDTVYSLDSEAGLIRFGDGLRGRIPEISRRIRVAQMRAGGGRAGNLPAGTLSAIRAELQEGGIVGAELQVRQPLPLAGGEDAETLAAAEKRIPELFRHRERAVTATDYQSLAAETPGVRLGRVELLPRFKPQQRNDAVPGAVSVLVLPLQERRLPPNPRPDRPTLERVHSWLDQRRPLATELYVIGCEYVPLGLSVGVDVRNGFGQDGVLQAVTDALRGFLWSLAPGGLDGQGWPLGRNVQDRELEVVVARVPGVAAVNGLRLFSQDPGSSNWREIPANATQAAALALQIWQLPELLAVVASAGMPAAGLAPTSSGNGGRVPVAVPILPEVC